MINIVSHSEEETTEFAANFADKISRSRNGAVIICFWGDLGMGKSLFCRSMIKTLCGAPDMDVPSPTFTLTQVYEMDDAQIWHFDLYRLSEPAEVYEIGWEDALSGGISLIEWPERLGELLPAKRIDVRLEPIENQPNQRKITVIHHGRD